MKLNEKQKEELHKLLFELDWNERFDESLNVEKQIIKFIEGLRWKKLKKL